MTPFVPSLGKPRIRWFLYFRPESGKQVNMVEREVLTNVKAGRAATRHLCELVDAQTGAAWIRQRSPFGFLLMGERFWKRRSRDNEIGGVLPEATAAIVQPNGQTLVCGATALGIRKLASQLWRRPAMATSNNGSNSRLVSRM